MEQVASFEAAETSGLHDVPVRAGVPVKFSNDWFEGSLLLFVRDPAVPVTAPGTFTKRYWVRLPALRLASSCRLRLTDAFVCPAACAAQEVQLQGRFKRAAEHFCMGMEISEVLRLNFVLRSLSSTLVSFVRSYEPDVHCAFGSAKAGADVEMPHLVAPAFKGCDLLLETAEGETPPTLGTDLTGGMTHPKGGRPTSIRLDRTYTMCVFSTCIDLSAWKLTGTPIGNVDISTFLGKQAAVRIVFYTLGAVRETGCRAPHANADKSYILCLRLDPPALRKSICDERPPPLPAANGALAAEAPLASAAVVGGSGHGGSGHGGSSFRKTMTDAAAAASELLMASSRASSTKAGQRHGRRKTPRPAGAAGGTAAPPAVAAPDAHKGAPRQAETPPSPPLFRTAIAIAAADGGIPSPARASGSPTESELAAEQRLLMWMAGTPHKRVARSRRRNSGEGRQVWRWRGLLTRLKPPAPPPHPNQPLSMQAAARASSCQTAPPAVSYIKPVSSPASPTTSPRCAEPSQ